MRRIFYLKIDKDFGLNIKRFQLGWYFMVYQPNWVI